MLHMMIRAVLVLAAALVPWTGAGAETLRLLHANYSPTDLFFYDFNRAFAEYYRGRTGVSVEIQQRPDTTARHLSAILGGELEADVVTFNSSVDVDYIVEHSKLIEYRWKSAFPNNSSPFTTNVVFLVRSGNPKGIRDWNDLIEKDVRYVTTSPRTSGFGRYAYYSMYIYAHSRFGGDEQRIRDYLRQYIGRSQGLLESYYHQVDTFIRRGEGDVLLVWEHAALMAMEHHGRDNFELVVPSVSLVGRPRIAVISANAARHGTTDAAREYVRYLYSDVGQELAVKYFLRPENMTIARKYRDRYPRISHPDISRFGSMGDFYRRHFSEGGWFDQLEAEAATGSMDSGGREGG